MHGVASWYQPSQEERPTASAWPANKGSMYPSAGNEGSFSPTIASFSPQPVPDSPLLHDGSKPLYFWTQLALPSPTAVLWPLRAAGTSPWPDVPACTLCQWWHMRPLKWQLVKTRQGWDQPHRACWGTRSKCSFGHLFWRNTFSSL